MMTEHTAASIRELLTRSNLAVERAMVVLYERQTRDEQAVSNTKHTNQRGFSAFHAKTGSYYGRWCMTGRHLTGKHLDKARRMAIRYTRQLLDEVQLQKKLPKRPKICSDCTQPVLPDGYCACRGYGS